MNNADIYRQDHATNLGRLVWLRYIVIGGEAAAILYGERQLHLMLPVLSLALLLGVMTIINTLTWLRLRLKLEVTSKELFIQLSVDVVGLTILLYLTGGSTNPFAPLYLLPLILTASILPGRHTWAMLVMTVICYSGLFFYFIDLPSMHGSHDHGFQLHVFGMWIGFLFSAILIASFVVHMAATVNKQNKKISDMREKHLRQEQVLALGTLAAGAAHELGTPLSTMTILLQDMEPGQAINADDLYTLQEQLQRCRKILGSISDSAGTTRAICGSKESLEKHFRTLIEEWQQTRQVNPALMILGDQPSPMIVADQTLDQAFINIFNNAADASQDDIEISIHWSEVMVTVDVSDRGKGLAQDITGHTGTRITSTKQDGLGLGLFLTFATLERIGGTVQLLNRKGGGVSCQVQLPLDAILISNNNE